MADPLLRAALNALAMSRLPVQEAIAGGVPDRPGLYAIYAAPAIWNELGLGEPPDDRPLYVGKAEDSLDSRDLKTHFVGGTTGRSSPRRSFAALLADGLDLRAMPRRPDDPEPKKWTHYALEEPGDTALTDWMRDALELGVWLAPTGTLLRPVERDLMRHWEPPLNLTGVVQPWKKQVRAVRDVLAADAKQWARDRGLL